MNSIVAEYRVQKALKKKIPPVADFTYNPEDEVQVYSEQRKLWDGPFIVLHTDGTKITIQNKQKTLRKAFNAFQVKPSYSEYEQNLSQP